MWVSWHGTTSPPVGSRWTRWSSGDLPVPARMRWSSRAAPVPRGSRTGPLGRDDSRTRSTPASGAWSASTAERRVRNGCSGLTVAVIRAGQAPSTTRVTGQWRQHRRHQFATRMTWWTSHRPGWRVAGRRLQWGCPAVIGVLQRGRCRHPGLHGSRGVRTARPGGSRLHASLRVVPAPPVSTRRDDLAKPLDRLVVEGRRPPDRRRPRRSSSAVRRTPVRQATRARSSIGVEASQPASWRIAPAAAFESDDAARRPRSIGRTSRCYRTPDVTVVCGPRRST